MLLNIDTSSGEPKSAPFRADVAAKLAEIMDAHKALPLPKFSGRAIALPQKN
jgi:acyl-CoA thioester hydrolase